MASNILTHFSVERFSSRLNECPEGVLLGLELADKSSLIADSYKTNSRGAIRRIRSIYSIFLYSSKTVFYSYNIYDIWYINLENI